MSKISFKAAVAMAVRHGWRVCQRPTRDGQMMVLNRKGRTFRIVVG